MQYTEAIMEGNITVEEPVAKPSFSGSSIFNKFATGQGKKIVVENRPIDEDTLIKPRKRGRPRKNKDNDEITVGGDAEEIVTNKPYIDSYEETNDLIKIMIGQIDGLQGELKQEFNDIRLSKIRGKYQYH